jgi:hypothetical protein
MSKETPEEMSQFDTSTMTLAVNLLDPRTWFPEEVKKTLQNEYILEQIKRGGNGRWYLSMRIARKNPDLIDAIDRGDYPSVRAAAIAAGIIRPKEPLDQLFDAWHKASVEDRRLFLWMVEDDADFRPEPETVPRGPRPYSAVRNVIPALKELLASGYSVSGVARALGVNYRTVCRWRWGNSKPRKAVLEKLAALRLAAVVS